MSAKVDVLREFQEDGLVSDPPERRKERRYRIGVPLEYVCSERMLPGTGTLMNISISGMYVEDARHDLDVGDIVRAPLWLFSEATTAFLEGPVVRVAAGGFAVRFDNMNSTIADTLRETLPLAEARYRSRRRFP